jgi:hypothetical protein
MCEFLHLVQCFQQHVCSTPLSLAFCAPPSTPPLIAHPSFSQVRRHAVGVLSQLLAEDFIKLRGSMFFRLAQCLGDHDARVRALAEQVQSHNATLRGQSVLGVFLFEGLLSDKLLTGGI